MIEVSDIELFKISRSFQIPSKPAVLARIQEEFQRPVPSIQKVADLIKLDVGLSAFLLKIINSPAYGMSRQIADIQQSAMMLGFRSLENLVSGYFLQRAFDGKACISLNRFWDSATLTAQMMCQLCRQLDDPLPLDMVYAFGLFHDCGIPSFAIKYPDYLELLHQANDHEQDILCQLEDQRYLTNHAIIGYFMSASWSLPNQLCQLILHHHDPAYFNAQTPEPNRKAMAIFKLTEHVYQDWFQQCGAPGWGDIESSVLNELNLTPKELKALVPRMLKANASEPISQ